MEVDLLRENRGGAKSFSLAVSSSPSGVDLVDKSVSVSCRNGGKLHKNYFNIEEILNDPYKTRLYLEKLKSQLRERVRVCKASALFACFKRDRPSSMCLVY